MSPSGALFQICFECSPEFVEYCESLVEQAHRELELWWQEIATQVSTHVEPKPSEVYRRQMVNAIRVDTP